MFLAKQRAFKGRGAAPVCRPARRTGQENGAGGGAAFFSIDETAFYLLDAQQLHTEEPEGFFLAVHAGFPQYGTLVLAFGGITACHLWRWEQSRQYCGRCGTKTEHSQSERALFCPKCGLMEYPKISPAVIVAISDGDKLLMAKNANPRAGAVTLIAGFVEIGESFEQTVHREAMEEVGIRLKNVRYYKSQPWGFSDTVMIGFTAELDGSGEFTLQQSEIADAKWVRREDIPGGELYKHWQRADRELSAGQIKTAHRRILKNKIRKLYRKFTVFRGKRKVYGEE